MMPRSGSGSSSGLHGRAAGRSHVSRSYAANTTVVQVKGGGVNRSDVATLLGDVENQKAAGGILITLEKPTKQMRTEAADAGRFASKLWHDKDYPRIQILTVEGLLNGTEHIDAPPQLNPFAMAARESAREKQTELL